jgi:hypothetical protein
MLVSHPPATPFHIRHISFDFESFPPDLTPAARLHLGIDGEPRPLVEWALALERVADALRNHKE